MGRAMAISDDDRRAFDEAAQMLARSRHAIALVGAGMSAESGIPTFRGPGGLWTKKGEPDMRMYDSFIRDPKEWWEQRLRPQDPDMAAFARRWRTPSRTRVTTRLRRWSARASSATS